MCFRIEVLVMMTAVGACFGQTMNDTQNILSSILTNYNPDIRPADNQSLPAEVNITMDLIHIKEFDEVSELLTVVIIMKMTWWDSRLLWDPLEYNYTEFVTIPAKNIWKPNLILNKPVGKIRPVGGEQDWAVARCAYDGTVSWSPADTIISSCNVDVTYFPFDKQNCDLEFIPWGFQTNQISLYGVQDKVLLTYFTENGAWNLANSATLSRDIGGYFSMYSVRLVLERRPTFFLVNAVLPVIFISFLNVIVFLIPVECGERVSYAITVYLAMAVFMTIVADNLPKTSKKMAIICYFLLINVAHSTLICFETILCLITYYRKTPVPMWLSSIFTCGTKTCKGRKTKVENINLDVHPEKQFDEMTHINSKDGKWAKHSCQQTDKSDKLDENSCSRDVANATWREISCTLDKIFGAVSVLLLLLSSVTLIIVVVVSWS